MEGTLVVYGSADEVEDGTDLGSINGEAVVVGGGDGGDMAAETDDAAEESTEETSEDTAADESTDESDA